jgi:hypothetical protein
MFEPLMLFLLGLLVISLIYSNTMTIWQKRQHKKQTHYLENYPFPEGIRSKLSQRYPQLSNESMQRVEQAMRQYFRIHQQAGRFSVAMPSKIVDEYWHEFILHTENYALFCEKALGRFIHHKPASASTDQVQDETLRRAWRLACNDERISTLQTVQLPLLFLIDWELNIPDGFLHNSANLISTVSSTSSDGCSSASSMNCGSGDCSAGASCCGNSCGGGGGGGGGGD